MFWSSEEEILMEALYFFTFFFATRKQCSVKLVLNILC